MEIRGRIWRWYWGGWLLSALYFTGMGVAFGGGHPFWSLLRCLLQAGNWGTLGMLVIAVARLFPLENLGWNQWRRWAPQFLFCLCLAVLGVAISSWLAITIGGIEHGSRNFEFLPAFRRLMVSNYHFQVYVLLMLAGITHFLRISARAREQEVAAAENLARFHEAQNLVLRMQIHPHFLFNTLNSIGTLMHVDLKGADRMLGLLGRFMRGTLEQTPGQFHALREELTFLENYLEIEKIRFGSRLSIQREIPASCLDAHVPPFLLQPLVENALKHGLSDLPQGGTLTLRALENRPFLELQVQDDGQGFQPGKPERVGLGNVRSRLNHLYPGQHRMSVETAPDMGTTITLSIPFERSVCEPASPDHR